jgi:hypothetical protein
MTAPPFPPAITALDTADTTVISSTAINAKVTQILKLLDPLTPVPGSATAPQSSGSAPAAASRLVHISSRSKDASKAITVAEIVKRSLSERGMKCYQYTTAAPVLAETDRAELGKPQAVKTTAEDGQEEDEDVEEEDAFEELGTPEERRRMEKPLKRVLPKLHIWLSRERVEILRTTYGEQVNKLVKA